MRSSAHFLKYIYKFFMRLTLPKNYIKKCTIITQSIFCFLVKEGGLCFLQFLIVKNLRKIWSTLIKTRSSETFFQISERALHQSMTKKTATAIQSSSCFQKATTSSHSPTKKKMRSCSIFRKIDLEW